MYFTISILLHRNMDVCGFFHGFTYLFSQFFYINLKITLKLQSSNLQFSVQSHLNREISLKFNFNNLTEILK